MKEAVEDLRRRALETRRSLTPDEVEERSKKIVKQFIDWISKNLRQEELLVGCYRTTDGNNWREADPTSLLKSDALSFAHFAFPRIIDRFQGEMDFSIPIHSTDWAVGPYGFPEPRSDLPALSPETLDILLVPGVVFGRKGERIGSGKGFYDRFLVRAPGALRVGFAYDFQLQDTPLPQEKWDARMDWIVTESEIIETHARVV